MTLANVGIKDQITTNSETLKQVIDETQLNIEKNLKLNDELFINVSHELKTPIHIIYSAVQLLEVYLKEMEEKSVDKIVSRVNSIKQNNFRLMKVINNVLDLSKIESDLFDLNLNCINIVELAEDVVQRVSEVFRDKGINLIFDTNVEEKYIMADVEKIQRVILNLLSNAVKFSNNSKDIIVRIQVKNDYVKIIVKDSGVGIEKSNLDSIFNRFGQVDKSLTRTAEGSGMGLKLSKAIIDAHGGTIQAYNNKDKGTTFEIKLLSKNFNNIYSLYGKKLINLDSLDEMIKIEFSDIDLGA